MIDREAVSNVRGLVDAMLGEYEECGESHIVSFYGDCKPDEVLALAREWRAFKQRIAELEVENGRLTKTLRWWREVFATRFTEPLPKEGTPLYGQRFRFLIDEPTRPQTSGGEDESL